VAIGRYIDCKFRGKEREKEKAWENEGDVQTCTWTDIEGEEINPQETK
jgi:hypothetical protein